MSMELQLVEALCGFQKPVKTLDNRTLLITSHAGKHDITLGSNMAAASTLKSSVLLVVRRVSLIILCLMGFIINACKWGCHSHEALAYI